MRKFDFGVMAPNSKRGAEWERTAEGGRILRGKIMAEGHLGTAEGGKTWKNVA